MKRLLLTLLFTSGLYGASIDDLTFTLNEAGTEYSVTDCDTTASGSLEIPSNYNGLPVTSIGNEAFKNCSSLTSINIPDSVTSIGERAFLSCSDLTSITIPNSVTSIEQAAFFDCSSLTNITIPSNVSLIKSSVFTNCTSLISITIPDSVISIGINAFYSCRSLTSITIPSSVTSIGDNAFRECSGLTSITIPDSVTSIGDNAFNDCTSLTSVTIPDSVTSIGREAFYRCSDLTSITIGNGVTTIGDGTFSECRSLTSITIPNSVTSIGGGAFFDCSSLTNITIPNSVTSIGRAAFAFCPSLTSVTIPDSVTSIGERAFHFCFRLDSITFEGDAPTLGTDVFEGTDSVKVYYYNDATGFTSPTWQGAQAEMISRLAPVIVGIEKLEDGVNLWFNSAIGESYRIESSYDLENWTILEDQIPASSELIERLYSTDDYSRRFFRVILNTVEFTFIGTNNHDFSAYYGDEAIISAAYIPLYPTGTDKYYLASYQVIEWSSNTPIGGLQYGKPKVTVATTSSLIGHNLYIRFFKYDPLNANSFSTAGPPLSIDGDALAQEDQTVEAVSAVGVASQLGYSVRVWKEAKP